MTAAESKRAGSESDHEFRERIRAQLGPEKFEIFERYFDVQPRGLWTAHLSQAYSALEPDAKPTGVSGTTVFRDGGVQVVPTLTPDQAKVLEARATSIRWQARGGNFWSSWKYHSRGPIYQRADRLAP